MICRRDLRVANANIGKVRRRGLLVEPFRHTTSGLLEFDNRSSNNISRR